MIEMASASCLSLWQLRFEKMRVHRYESLKVSLSILAARTTAKYPARSLAISDIPSSCYFTLISRLSRTCC